MNEGDNLQIRVTSTQTGSRINAKFSVDDPGDYLRKTGWQNGQPPTQSLNFTSNNSWTFTLNGADRDNLDKEDGTVTIRLEPDPAQSRTYTVGETFQRIITVKDLDVPLISIKDAPETLETLPAEFELRSPHKTKRTISYKVSSKKYCKSTRNCGQLS